MDIIRNGRKHHGTLEEDAVLLAAMLVERAGAHPLLTEATSALWQAHGKLVDYIEQKEVTHDAPAS